jgi:hypothetical protein
MASTRNVPSVHQNTGVGEPQDLHNSVYRNLVVDLVTVPRSWLRGALKTHVDVSDIRYTLDYCTLIPGFRGCSVGGLEL